MKSISVWGWLGGRAGQRPMGEFGQDAGVTPLLFFKGHPEIFNDYRKSGPWFNVSFEGRCFLQYSVPITILGHRTHTDCRWAPPAGLSNTSSYSNLVFPGRLPSRYWPGSALLSFSGQPVLGCRVIWLLVHFCNSVLCPCDFQQLLLQSSASHDPSETVVDLFKGVIWCNFKFCCLFGVLQADCA